MYALNYIKTLSSSGCQISSGSMPNATSNTEAILCRVKYGASRFKDGGCLPSVASVLP